MAKIPLAMAIVVALYAVNGQRYNQDQASSPKGANCPEKNARYPVNGQCDSYIECRDGVGEEKMCPDGLMFNTNSSVFTYPCSYPIDVDCTGRTATQKAIPTEDCPHQFGYFRVGISPSECGQFMNCVDGRSFTFDCPEGLAFSVDTYRCDWPDMVPDCDAEAFLGFSCPPEPTNPFFGASEHRFFRSPSDCQRYYVCVNGKPRLYNCGEGNAYNELILACDGIENVTSCATGPQYKQTQLTNQYQPKGQNQFGG